MCGLRQFFSLPLSTTLLSIINSLLCSFNCRTFSSFLQCFKKFQQQEKRLNGFERKIFCDYLCLYVCSMVHPFIYNFIFQNIVVLTREEHMRNVFIVDDSFFGIKSHFPICGSFVCRRALASGISYSFFSIFGYLHFNIFVALCKFRLQKEVNE